MSIPTYADRIETKYETQYPLIKESINSAILTGYAHTSSNGLTYYTAGVGDGWPEEELVNYLIKEYDQAGWILEFEWADRDAEAGRVIVEIYKKAE